MAWKRFHKNMARKMLASVLFSLLVFPCTTASSAPTDKDKKAEEEAKKKAEEEAKKKAEEEARRRPTTPSPASLRATARNNSGRSLTSRLARLVEALIRKDRVMAWRIA